MAEEEGITAGPICLLEAVESCFTFEIHRGGGMLSLVPKSGACLHQYAYFMDEQVGLCHVRMQTWLPLDVRVMMNGREWLFRELAARGSVMQTPGQLFYAGGRLFLNQLVEDFPGGVVIDRHGGLAAGLQGATATAISEVDDKAGAGGFDLGGIDLIRPALFEIERGALGLLRWSWGLYPYKRAGA